MAACTASSVPPDVLLRIDDRPIIRPGEVSIRWLGAAGFEVRAPGGVLLLDPYLTRQSVPSLLFGRLDRDEETLRRATPEADVITIGHSHYDHLFDAPSIAARTQATIFASHDACGVVARLDARAGCRAVEPARVVSAGPFELLPIPAAHGQSVFGVPLDGNNDAPVANPHVMQLRVGQTFIWRVRVEGLTIVHASSAGLPDDPDALIDGADILLLTLALRENSPGYVRHMIDVLQPRVVIPHHPALPSFELTDPLPDDIREAFDAFAKEEAANVNVQIPAPFVPYKFSSEKRAELGDDHVRNLRHR